MAEDEPESEPEVEVRTDVLGNLFRRGDRLLITGGPPFFVGGRGESSPDKPDAGKTQLAEQQVDASGVDLVVSSPRNAAISS